MIAVGTDKVKWVPTTYEDYVPDLPTAYAILSLQTRTTATPVQRLSYLTFILKSNCFIRVLDPECNLVGYDHITGLGENNMPTAVYSGPFSEPQYIVIVNPVPGIYKLELLGTSEGPYNLTIQGKYGGKVTDTIEYSENIGEGELRGSHVTVTAIVGPMDLYMDHPPQLEKILAGVPQFDPMPLNLKFQGKYITTCVELPAKFNPLDVDVSSILFNGTIPVDPSTNATIGDYDNDAVPDLTLQFNRTQVSELILSSGIKFGDITLTITGQLENGTNIEGIVAISVRMPGDVNMDGKVDVYDAISAANAFGCKCGELKWNQATDENEDGTIDIFDIITIAGNFGRTYT
jgi:hypothetical protein